MGWVCDQAGIVEAAQANPCLKIETWGTRFGGRPQTWVTRHHFNPPRDGPTGVQWRVAHVLAGLL
jgi:hypothetical protein